MQRLPEGKPLRILEMRMGNDVTESTEPATTSQLDSVTGQGRFAKLFGKFKHVKTVIASLAAGGAVLSGLAGYWTTYRTVKENVPASTGKVAASNASALSILVLPFANQSGDPQKAYIADELTTSITSDLSRIRDAFIIPTATAYAYKDKTATVQQVGKDAGVRFVLQGSVLSSGEKIRIGAQLADTQTGAQLWSESFDGELTNLFALQDHVTTRIVNTIGREIVVMAVRESETRKSSPKVADLMLRARALFLQPQSIKNLQQMEDWYRQVLALDPNNAGAIVGLARSLMLPAFNFRRQLAPELREKNFGEAHDLVLKAKELDSSDPEIYPLIALYASYHDDYAGSRRASETWLSLQPKNPIAYNFVAASLLLSGEPKRALELLTQAIDLDPKHPSEQVLLTMARAHFAQGDNDATIEWSHRGLEANRRVTELYAGNGARPQRRQPQSRRGGGGPARSRPQLQVDRTQETTIVIPCGIQGMV